MSSRPAHLVCIQCVSCQDPTCPIPGAFPCRCPNGVRWQARRTMQHDAEVLAFHLGELTSAILRHLPGWRYLLVAAVAAGLTYALTR